MDMTLYDGLCHLSQKLRHAQQKTDDRAVKQHLEDCRKRVRKILYRISGDLRFLKQDLG